MHDTILGLLETTSDISTEFSKASDTEHRSEFEIGVLFYKKCNNFLHSCLKSISWVAQSV